MKFLAIAICTVFVSSAAFADKETKKKEDHSHHHAHDGHDHKHGEHDHAHGHAHAHKDTEMKATFLKDSIKIKVKGMVCAFCAQGVEKRFGKMDEVESVKVSLDDMEVNIKLKKGKTLSKAVVKENIEDAGFSFVSAN